MKNITFFLSENFMFLEVKFSIYLNRRVFVMPPLFLRGLLQKPTDLDLHCWQRRGISGISRTRVNVPVIIAADNILKYIFFQRK